MCERDEAVEEAEGMGSDRMSLMNCVSADLQTTYIYIYILFLSSHNRIRYYVDTSINTPAASGTESSTDNYFVARRSQADWTSAIGRVVYRSRICIQ